MGDKEGMRVSEQKVHYWWRYLCYLRNVMHLQSDKTVFKSQVTAEVGLDTFYLQILKKIEKPNKNNRTDHTILDTFGCPVLWHAFDKERSYLGISFSLGRVWCVHRAALQTIPFITKAVLAFPSHVKMLLLQLYFPQQMFFLPKLTCLRAFCLTLTQAINLFKMV